MQDQTLATTANNDAICSQCVPILHSDMDIRGLDWNLGPPDRIHKLFARRKQRQRVDTSKHKGVAADIQEEEEEERWMI